jgi:hypothetical protein
MMSLGKNSKINQLIYVSNPIESSVVESQVYKLLEYFNKTDYFNEVILIQISNNKKSYNLAKKILTKYNFKVEFIKGSIGLLTKFNPIYFRLSAQLKSIISSNNFIIHVRTESLGFHVVNSLRKNNLPLNVLCDVRGLTIEELDYRLKNITGIRTLYPKLMKLTYRKLIKFFNTNNISISAVSKELKKYLVQSGIDNYIEVNPNIVSSDFSFNIEQRESVRKKLAISKEKILIVLSSSGSDIWQKDESVVSFFLKNDNFIILNLSKNKIINNKIINLYLPFEEMPKYLSAADIGVVWREDHILNNCASPSKFSEFAAMGLYVIHNNTVDLISKYIKHNSSGLLISKIEEFTLKSLIFLDNTRRSNLGIIGKNTFGVEAISENYFMIYKNILK